MVSLAASVSRADAASKDVARESRAHFDSGSRHFDLAEYESALAEFKQAYQIKPDAVYLFNIAQCHRLLGHVEDAIVFYKNYLRKSPDAPNREDVERRLEELEAVRKNPEVNTAAAATPAKDAPAPATPAAPLPTPEASVPAPGGTYPQTGEVVAGPEVVAIPGEEAATTEAGLAPMSMRKKLGWAAGSSTSTRTGRSDVPGCFCMRRR